MIQHRVTIHLNRPVEEVFAFVTDSTNLHKWQSNLLESQPLTEKPLQVGTRFREVRLLGRRATEIQAEITDFEPNRRFSTRTLTEPHASVSYSMDPEDGGTRLTYEFALHTSGMMRLFAPLIANSIKKETECDFEKLKSIIEGRTSPMAAVQTGA